MQCEIRIGTSGWYYRHWLGDFYPVKMKLSQAFGHYANHFNTVEINNSFYALPSEKTVIKWKEGSPPDFLFAAKGSRYLTHIKKFKKPEEALDRFFWSHGSSGQQARTDLFQFPGNWNLDYERLAIFLGALPAGKRYVFEFRAATWFTSPIYDLLRNHNAAFCLYDRAGEESPLEITADFTYIRMHGAAAQWNGNYVRALLLPWAERIATWRENLTAVYCYFNNDFGGHAIRNAKELADLIR